MITYHALGYYSLYGIPLGILACRLAPAGSTMRRITARITLAALLLVAATVALSY
ncbi:hypothetical protein [Streptomyces sp. adm13(2018)]|uniref:hypothetical protein n=1 Tax=Streptomyces sp. adm13(2018) TaxID=2479007 RepID=UPI00164F57C7|nr:hypothetical protein [Streptomyces sp. adm13(2018)]